ncbi:hypothetical protein J15TS10_49320 [Paenibacillus woosongensis]|uniref:CARDB domain-containing protein n=2 Tax=Paenibacillus woosongensis TaxID=307580 RepID=A0ABQ4MYV4_9BACL|nr:hypothetical protein J15TS10_49320 [Paenibacillus woosongensis]
MLSKYVNFSYGDTLDRFNGFIPALNKRVERNPWQLDRWEALFNFTDQSSRTISNYDVFSVKRMPEDEKFDKENGFGLVYKSPEAFGDLFDAVWAGQSLSERQRAYFKDKFIANANDPVLTYGHNWFYEIEQQFHFIRTAEVIQRMGAKFDATEKIGQDKYRAIFQISPWPTLKVTQGDALSITYTASGYSERDIRLVAAPKGAFPDLSKVVSLTDGKLIHTSEENLTDTIEINAANISKVLGADVDIILDDGFGRTEIQSVKLPDAQSMDYVPTKLTLTEGGQLWVKYRYDGEDIITRDYVNDRGMPMTAAIKMGGAITLEKELPSMNESLPESLKQGQEFNYMLGKIEIGEAPGKYYIKVNATINNPNHPDRALESPSDAYKNNEIFGEWVVERQAAETDLIAVSVTASPSTIQKGNQTSISAKVRNEGAESLSNVLIRFTANNQTIYEVNKSIPANQTIAVGPFNWTGTNTGVHNIAVHVDPDKEQPDNDRSNNVATTGCNVTGSGSASDGGCNNPEVLKNWTVTYPVITGYPTKYRTVRWVDSQGKSGTSTESYTDYSDPIWAYRDVQYKEQLKVSAVVDTKQNIKTDLANPKESDQDSRGSWEIIPYAKKHNKNASEITRAGYGFELKVQTTYSTDWETKVPVGLAGTARPIGGNYYGPNEVYASIYDSQGKLEKTVKLEKTSGDRNTATWELPEVQVESESGKKYRSRKYFTSINAPDGEYVIRISTSAAGMNGLEACITKKVEIYGSMYDDVQNLRGTK